MESRKKEKFYELYGRPTIEYDASCGKGLDEGLLILDEIVYEFKSVVHKRKLVSVFSCLSVLCAS